MRELIKMVLSLRADVVEILVRAAPKGRKSAYVAAVIAARDRAWREALHYLQGLGWSTTDLRLAVGALAQVPASFTNRQELLAREFDLAGLAHFTSCVRKSCDVALALSTLADETRLGNVELARRLAVGVNNE